MSDQEYPHGVDWPMASSPQPRQPATSEDRIPIRTCVGCRERVDKADLVRLVIVGEELAVDRDATLPGRGAYLHSRPDCVESALRRRALQRALRWNDHLDTDSVSEQLTAGLPSSR